MTFTETVETFGKIVDLAGVVAIVVGIVIATVIFLGRVRHRDNYRDAYVGYRQHLGRALLLGLELLVAADIIRTIAIEPTLESVGVLAGIVLIRTFLSFALELEVSGRFPWQSEAK